MWQKKPYQLTANLWVKFSPNKKTIWLQTFIGHLIMHVPKLWCCGEPFKRKQEAEEEIHRPYLIWWSKVLLGRGGGLKRAGSRWDSPATGVPEKVTGTVKCGSWRRAEVRAKALGLQRSQPAKRRSPGLLRCGNLVKQGNSGGDETALLEKWAGQEP